MVDDFVVKGFPFCHPSLDSAIGSLALVNGGGHGGGVLELNCSKRCRFEKEKSGEREKKSPNNVPF